MDLDDNELIDIEVEGEEDIVPFDLTKIKIDDRRHNIGLILNRIKFGEIDLSPDFQRGSDIWNTQAKSRLIESMLIRIPLPAFYIDGTEENKWIVIDGQQRLTTIKQFVLGNEDNIGQDKFRLSNLEFLTQFNKKSYDELPRIYQRRIDETEITIYLIEKGTPEEVKFNIYKRINTGGLPLSSQEIRHAINRGKSSEFLENLAKSEEFIKATTNAVKDKRMAAREIILRFLAFKITPYTQFQYNKDVPNFDVFLNNIMKKINVMADNELKALESDFLKAMVAAIDIFGNDAFRKRSSREAKQSTFNRALFEAWSVNLSSLNNSQIEILQDKKDILTNKFIILNEDPSFINSITGGTSSTWRVKYRFEKIEELINKVLNN